MERKDSVAMLNTKKLKEIREMRDLSQSEVARRASIAQSHYTNIELGKKQPSVHTLSLILKVLGAELNDVWDDSDGTPPPIMPMRDDGIIVEKTVVTTRYNFPNTLETLEYLNTQMRGGADIDPDLLKVIEAWGKVGDEVRGKVMEVLGIEKRRE